MLNKEKKKKPAGRKKEPPDPQCGHRIWDDEVRTLKKKGYSRSQTLNKKGYSSRERIKPTEKFRKHHKGGWTSEGKAPWGGWYHGGGTGDARQHRSI